MSINFTFKKIISSLLLFSVFFVSSFSFYPQKVNAQLFSGGGNANATGTVGGIAAVAAGCTVTYFTKRKAAKAAATLARKGEEAAVDAVGDAAESLVGIDPTSIVDGTTPAPKVPVVDDAHIVTTKVESTKIDVENTLGNFKEECLDLIARYLALKAIDKITFMTVEWINSGFDGNPFYPEDRQNFFEQIAKDEITGFTGWFSINPADYPFGRIISETILLTVQNTVQDNLRFSLNQVLQHGNQYATYENFQARFSVGGWAGYRAFAQPNNNVFGNYLMATNHLARQTAGTNVTVAANFAKELQESGGLLNQRICRASETGEDDYISRTDPLYMGDYSVLSSNTDPNEVFDLFPEAVQNELSDVTSIDARREMINWYIQRSHCAQWETVTPGRFIAEQTTNALGSHLRSLELGDEVNENLGLIFDALIAQFAERGLRSFQRTDGNYSSDPNSPNYNALWAQANDPDFGSNYSQPSTQDILNGVSGVGGTSGGGGNENLLQIQQNYLLQAGSAIDSINTLVRDIRTLDYCIPGPNPRWYENGQINLENIVGGVYSGQTASYYADQVEIMTGINIQDSVVPDYNQFIAFINYVFTGYRQAMISAYPTSGTIPTVRPIATNLYSQITQLSDRVTELQNQITGIVSVMPQLQLIQSQMAALTPEQQADSSSPEMQTISSLLNQVINQGVLVNESQLNQLGQDILLYESQTFAANNYINQCIQEVTSVNYAGLNERIPYPYPSISQNASFSAIPAPNQNHYLSNLSFGDDTGQIDLSGFNGQNITVPTTSTQTFANILQSLF